MKTPKLMISLLLSVPMLLSSPPGQADPGKDESGHGRGQYSERCKVKERYEYKSGDCKYEYKSGPGGYKEERKCEGRSTEAGPPPWAPAHGYRSKQRHQGASEVHYGSPDYADGYVAVSEEIGIPSGTCDREALGGVLGGIVGGVVGSKIGKGDGRKLAVIAGTVMGVLVGRQIGRDMDEADQQCVGQVLERAADGQAIHWRNAGSGLSYEVTPLNTYERDGRFCREYVTGVALDSKRQEERGTACRNADGSWAVSTL